MPRGGKRQGTPGKGYSNRTDLSIQPNMNQNTAASGGMSAPAAPSQESQQPQRQMIYADQIPNLGDATTRPDEPITAGLSSGMGPGPEALGPMPPPPGNPLRQVIQAMMLVAPNPDLVRVLNRIDYGSRQ